MYLACPTLCPYDSILYSLSGASSSSSGSGCGQYAGGSGYGGRNRFNADNDFALQRAREIRHREAAELDQGITRAVVAQTEKERRLELAEANRKRITGMHVAKVGVTTASLEDKVHDREHAVAQRRSDADFVKKELSFALSAADRSETVDEKRIREVGEKQNNQMWALYRGGMKSDDVEKKINNKFIANNNRYGRGRDDVTPASVKRGLAVIAYQNKLAASSFAASKPSSPRSDNDGAA